MLRRAVWACITIALSAAWTTFMAQPAFATGCTTWEDLGDTITETVTDEDARSELLDLLDDVATTHSLANCLNYHAAVAAFIDSFAAHVAADDLPFPEDETVGECFTVTLNIMSPSAPCAIMAETFGPYDNTKCDGVKCEGEWTQKCVEKRCTPPPGSSTGKTYCHYKL